MNILLLNWRCPNNPKSGGAEYVVFELLKKRVKQGDQVTWFAMMYEGGKEEETVSDIRVIRQGGPLTVQRAARKWYAKHGKEIDLIIDQTHGWPFFAPRWARCPVLFYSNEVAGPIARFMLPFPFGYFYQLIEPWLIRQYRDVPAVSISPSTTIELRQYGYRAPIVTMPLACDTNPLTKLPAMSTKEKELTLLFTARLVPLKRPAEAIKTLAKVLERGVKAKLWIIGKGSTKYEEYLRELARQLEVADSVRFWGYVSLAKKQELMQRAHIVLITSIKEGWGLTVPEANALGTVGVTYNIAGVRDSNINHKTGLMSITNNPSSLADTVVELWQNQTMYERLRSQAWKTSKTRTWSKTQAAFDEGVTVALKTYGQR